jgi:hypothetical protein
MNGRYMIVTYVKKPNGKWDELTEFKNNLRTKHIQTAKVILDFKEKKLYFNKWFNVITLEKHFCLHQIC